MKKTILTTCAIFMIAFYCNTAFSQAVYRSNVSGNWNVSGTWTLVSGTDADGIPDSNDDAFIQSGHTITLTADADCKDLHVSTGTTSGTTGPEGSMVLGTYRLNLYGKLRCYYATVGTTPGTSYNLGYAVYPFSNLGGFVKAVGNSRALTVAGEWGADIADPTTVLFAFLVELNPGQTLTLGTDFKASVIYVQSGTFDLANNTVSLEHAFTGGGVFDILSGGTVTSSANGVNILQRSAALAGASSTIYPGGTLILTGSAPKIQMNFLDFQGTVIYSGASQTWLDKGSTGITPTVYGNVTLAGSGTKTTVAGTNVVINNTLSLQGTATAALGTSATLAYAASGSVLEYAGSALQTSSDAEFPAVTGPANLTINNTNGAALHSSRILTGTLTLTAGNLSLGNNNITVAGTSSGGATAYVVTNGSGKLTVKNISTQVLIPIGTATTYNPLAIGNGSNIGSLDYTVKVDVGFTAAAIANANLAINRTWYVTSSATPAGTVTVVFYYTGTPATDAGSLFSVAPATVDHGISLPLGYGWNVNQTGLTQTPFGGMYVASTTVSSFLGSFDFPMVIGNIGAILSASRSVDLTVQKQNTKAQLNWTINSTASVKEVIVERSANSRLFEKLVTIPSLITAYTDDNLLAGTNYYRIKVTDAAGKITYSAIAAIINSDAGFDIVSLLPNLVRTEMQLNVAAAKKTKLNVQVTDVAGRPVLKQFYKLTAGSSLLDINVSALAAGIYYLTGTTEEGTVKTVRFVKQ